MTPLGEGCRSDLRRAQSGLLLGQEFAVARRRVTVAECWKSRCRVSIHGLGALKGSGNG